MGDSGVSGSSSFSDGSSQGTRILVIRKCEGPGKLGKVGCRIGTEDGDGHDVQCGSSSMEESSYEMVSNKDIKAAKALFMMNSDVGGWSRYAWRSYLASVALERGHGDGISNDDDDNDDDQDDDDNTDNNDNNDLDDDVDHVDESERSVDDDVDDSDLGHKNLELGMRGSSRVGESDRIQSLPKSVKGHDQNLEEGSLRVNNLMQKVYVRRKNMDGKAWVGVSSVEEPVEEGDDQKRRRPPIGCNEMAGGSSTKKLDLSNDCGHGRNLDNRRMYDSEKGKSVMGYDDSSRRKRRRNSIGGSASPNSVMKLGEDDQESALAAPTVHRGFSFSILHLLSAVHVALVTTPQGKRSSESHKDHGLGGEGGGSSSGQKQKKYSSVNAKCRVVQAADIPSLVLEEIVERVRSNPGDPRILQHHEPPLKVLVKGVLKVLSSEEGGKGWMKLVSYRKSSRCWSWIGPPVPSSIPLHHVDISSKGWGLPWRMLVMMVDSFGNWLLTHQEKLQQLGSLPTPPPVTLTLSEMNPAERFKDVSGRKCTPTINPSPYEVKAYFHQEEMIRYSMPDRAFSYTALDGRKSTVAPLPKTGWKPPPRARDHFLLKPDRPGNVTLLSVVRDAAARLPRAVGTRGDVCTLLRDSQYIMDDISDQQLNQVVSGALDRLHYEFDPCVQFDRVTRLWVYLHGERQEDDFQEGGSRTTVRRLK